MELKDINLDNKLDLGLLKFCRNAAELENDLRAFHKLNNREKRRYFAVKAVNEASLVLKNYNERDLFELCMTGDTQSFCQKYNEDKSGYFAQNEFEADQLVKIQHHDMLVAIDALTVQATFAGLCDGHGVIRASCQKRNDKLYIS